MPTVSTTLVNPYVRKEMEIQEKLQYIKHWNHLRQNQHTTSSCFQLLKQDSQSFHLSCLWNKSVKALQVAFNN